MRHFVDDDAGYADWLAEHPEGFVVNTSRTPSSAYLVLHAAGCPTISGAPARGSTFTGEYTKVCGTREELESFARQLGGQASPCGMCLARERRGSGGPARGGGKYGPLRDHLALAEGSQVQMTFAEVEGLVGRPAGREPGPYIDPSVATALTTRAAALGLDPAKLARLIAELNDNYGRGNAYAAHALLRALLDHIPPMLGHPDFRAAASSHPWGRTDRNYARKLADFKLQADDALHRQISAKTDLLGIDDMPPRVWVNRILQECAS